jgi:hypothetical protein
VAARNVGVFGQLKLALTGRNMAMEIRSLLTKSLSELWEFAAPGFAALRAIDSDQFVACLFV